MNMTRKVHLKLTGHSDAFQDPHKTVVWTCMMQMMSTNQILWVPAGLQVSALHRTNPNFDQDSSFLPLFHFPSSLIMFYILAFRPTVVPAAPSLHIPRLHM